MSIVPENPLTRREKRVIRSNGQMQGEPCPECGRTVHVVSLTDGNRLYVSHEDDGVGLDSRSDRGETDGCRLDAEQEPDLTRNPDPEISL